MLGLGREGSSTVMERSGGDVEGVQGVYEAGAHAVSSVFNVCKLSSLFLLFTVDIFADIDIMQSTPHDEAASGQHHVVISPEIPRLIVSPWKHHFISRAVHIINTIAAWSDWYVCPRMCKWLHDLEARVSRSGMAEMLFDLFHPDAIRLLSADSPPSAQQLLNLVTRPDGSYYAAYACIVKITASSARIRFVLYHGSATSLKSGFTRRKQDYKKLQSMPKFIEDLIAGEDEFEILAVIPMMRTSQNAMRPAIIFVEGMLMLWNRTLKEGGEYEKVMKASPWAADDLLLVRGNTVSSLREFPQGIEKTPEDIEVAHEKKKKYDLAWWKNMLANETPGEKRARLAKTSDSMKETRKRKRDNEPAERKTERLATKAADQERVRAETKATETPQQKAERLEKQAMASKKYREKKKDTESAEQRAERLAEKAAKERVRAGIKAAEIKTTETPQQKAERLEKHAMASKKSGAKKKAVE